MNLLKTLALLPLTLVLTSSLAHAIKEPRPWDPLLKQKPPTQVKAHEPKTLQPRKPPKKPVSESLYQKAKKEFVISTVHQILTTTYIRRAETTLDYENLKHLSPEKKPVDFVFENIGLKDKKLKRFLRSRTEMLSQLYDNIPEALNPVELKALTESTIDTVSEKLVALELLQQQLEITPEDMKHELRGDIDRHEKNIRYLLDVLFVTVLKAETTQNLDKTFSAQQIQSLQKIRALFYSLAVTIPVIAHFLFPTNQWAFVAGEAAAATMLGPLVLDPLYRRKTNGAVFEHFKQNRDRNLELLSQGLQRNRGISPLFVLQKENSELVQAFASAMDSILPITCRSVLTETEVFEVKPEPDFSAEVELESEFQNYAPARRHFKR